jgi:hypothetical protein
MIETVGLVTSVLAVSVSVLAKAITQWMKRENRASIVLQKKDGREVKIKFEGKSEEELKKVIEQLLSEVAKKEQETSKPKASPDNTVAKS